MSAIYLSVSCVAGLAKYEGSRNLADASAVSKLSPYIHFGQVSARQVLSVVGAHGGKQASKTFWRRLVWRDLAYWQLYHWPNMSTHPIRAFYEGQARALTIHLRPGHVICAQWLSANECRDLNQCCF